jgi:hypothetical protein
MNPPLHTFHDGSILHVMSAQALIKVPVWKGNRILDTVHADSIQKAIGSSPHLLDSGYRIIYIEEGDAAGKTVYQPYLIDGQHRAEVLRRHFTETLCEPDFPVLVTVYQVENESKAIAFFNAINNCKPQVWRLDPNLIINKYVDALVKRYGSDKKKCFLRPGTTRRPYLSVDTVRIGLRLSVEHLKQTEEEVAAFAEAVDLWNKKELAEAMLRLAAGGVLRDVVSLERAVEVGFMLAFDGTHRWIRECLG